MVRPSRWSNPQSSTLKASTLTITQPMWSWFINRTVKWWWRSTRTKYRYLVELKNYITFKWAFVKINTGLKAWQIPSAYSSVNLSICQPVFCIWKMPFTKYFYRNPVLHVHVDIDFSNKRQFFFTVFNSITNVAAD